MELYNQLSQTDDQRNLENFTKADSVGNYQGADELLKRGLKLTATQLHRIQRTSDLSRLHIHIPNMTLIELLKARDLLLAATDDSPHYKRVVYQLRAEYARRIRTFLSYPVYLGLCLAAIDFSISDLMTQAPGNLAYPLWHTGLIVAILASIVALLASTIEALYIRGIPTDSIPNNDPCACTKIDWKKHTFFAPPLLGATLGGGALVAGFYVDTQLPLLFIGANLIMLAFVIDAALALYQNPAKPSTGDVFKPAYGERSPTPARAMAAGSAGLIGVGATLWGVPALPKPAYITLSIALLCCTAVVIASMVKKGWDECYSPAPKIFV